MRRRRYWVSVGVRYCLEHEGIANEDDEVCDFSSVRMMRSSDEDRACRFRQLYRMELK
jgi:hypothetical protein